MKKILSFSFLNFTEKIAAFIYFLFVIKLHFDGGVQTQTFSGHNLFILFLGVVTIILLSRIVGLVFCGNGRLLALVQAFFLVLYAVIGFYHFRSRVPLDYSLIFDNLSLIFYKESGGVIFSAIKVIDYIQLLILIAALIFIQKKYKQLSVKKCYKRWYLQLPLLLGGYVFILLSSPFLYEEYSTFIKSIIRYHKYEDLSLLKNIPSKQFPYVRQFTSNSPQKRPHVFIITVESFNAGFVKTKSETGVPYTPFYNSLADKGWYFSNFFGHSVQTSKGQFGIYCSLWPLTKQKVFKRYANLRVRCLPHVLKRNGYTTLFFKGYEKIKFDNTGVFARRMGFDHVHGMSNKFVSDQERKKYKWGWGIQDNIFYKKFFEYLDKLKEDSGEDFRAFSALTTISNHLPFVVPERLRFVYPKQKTQQHWYANSIHVTDQYLKSFFSELKKRDYLQDSIVIVTGDHSFPAGEHESYSNEQGYYNENFKTPLVIWWKQLQPRHFKKPYSQADLAPTVLDLLGISTKASFLGNSILNAPDNPIPLIQPYDGTYLSAVIWPLKYVSHRRTGKEFCYNLELDPREEKNLISDYRGSESYKRFLSLVDAIYLNDYLIRSDRIWGEEL